MSEPFEPLLPDPTPVISNEPYQPSSGMLQNFIPTSGQQGSAIPQQQQQRQIDDGTGFWPTTLATMAALSGQFGPAIALQEQKRKASLARYMQPELLKIDNMTASGDLKGAGKALAGLAASVGPRDAEVLSFLKQKDSQLYQQHLDRQHLDAALTTLKENIPQDDPRYKTLETIDKLHKNGSYAGLQLGTALYNKLMDTHIQYVNGQAVSVDPISLGMTTQTIPTVVEQGQLSARAQTQLPAEFGTDLSTLINIANNKPFRNADGQMIQPTPQEVATVKQRIGFYQGQQGQINLAQNIPVSPEQNVLEAQQGFTPFQRATRETGGATGATATLAGQATQAARVAGDVAVQTAMVKPGYLEDIGAVAVNSTVGPDFGKPLPATSLGVVMKSGGNISIVNQKAFDAHVLPAMQSLDKLTYVKKMFAELGLTAESSWLDRLTVAARRKLESQFGISLEENDTAAKAAQVIADRALNDLAGTGTVPEREMATLRNMMTGAFATRESALHAADLMKERAQFVLGVYMDRNKVQGNEEMRTQQQPSSQQQGQTLPSGSTPQQPTLQQQGTPKSNRPPKVKFGPAIGGR